jgi:DivIVA domain-containing protein
VLIVEVVVVVLVLFAIAAVVAGRGELLSRPAPDTADPGLPADRALQAEDVAQLSFRVGLRGYRMDDVDRALSRLADAFAELERENAALRDDRERIRKPPAS